MSIDLKDEKNGSKAPWHVNLDIVQTETFTIYLNDSLGISVTLRNYCIHIFLFKRDVVYKVGKVINMDKIELVHSVTGTISFLFSMIRQSLFCIIPIVNFTYDSFLVPFINSNIRTL